MISRRWLIYALGGGWGHLHRCLALARTAARTHFVRVLANSPYALAIAERLQNEDIFLHLFDPKLEFVVACSEAVEILRGEDYDCLIVDTFPRGLGGEIAAMRSALPIVPRVLVHRDVNPGYVWHKNLRDFVAKTFDLVLIPGEGETPPLADLPQVKHTNPWLIRNGEELPDRDRARSLLGISPGDREPVVVVLASGMSEELVLYGKLTHALHGQLQNAIVRCLSAVRPPGVPEELWRFHWPAIECLVAADAIVGGGGYNTTCECQALAIPLVMFPFKRLYDRQGLRGQRLHANPATAPVVVVHSLEAAIAAVRDMLDRPRSPRPDLENGVVRACQEIEALFA